MGKTRALSSFPHLLHPVRIAMLLLNFRPEFHAPWMEKASYQQLPLLPLGPEAIAELLDDLLGRDPSRAELHELLRDRTGGNPLFVEEAVQALIEAGSLEGSRGACRVVRPIARKPTAPRRSAVSKASRACRSASAACAGSTPKNACR